MSTGEFISVWKKGEANNQAVFLHHRDFSRKAFQRRRRLWDIKDVEQRHRSGHWHDLSHKKKSDSNSLAQPSLSTERHTNTESHSEAVKTKEDVKAFCTDETQHSPPEFVSIHVSCHTSAEQDQADLGGKFKKESPEAGKDTFTNTKVNEENPPQNHFGNELAHNTEKEGVTASHLENEKETLCQSPNAFRSYSSSLDLKEDAHTVILRRHAETDPYSQFTHKVIQVRVTEFTVAGTVKKAGHETDLKSNTSAESKSVCQPILCKILDETEDTLFPLPPDSDSTEIQVQHNQACPIPDMLTSSVMTTLRSNWSSRSKKQKQGAPDVNLNATEQEMQRRRQEPHLSSSAFSRDFPQQPFFRDPKFQIGDVFPEMSNKENAHSINGSKSSTDSLSNLSNLRNDGPGKQSFSGAFSAKTGGGQTNVEKEVVNLLTSPVDTIMGPVSPHAVDINLSRSERQPGQFSSMNTPPITTGSLLLSFRQTNFSSSSTGTPAETHPLSPNSSFNSQKKNVSRMSEPLSYVTLQRNRKKNLSPTHQPIQNTADRTKGASGVFQLSVAPEERQQESLRPCMFLYPNTSNEMSSPNTTSDREQTPISPRYNKFNGMENMPLSPSPGSMLRWQQTIEPDNVLQGTSPHSFALRHTHTLSNVSDFLNNNNNTVRAMLTGDSVGTESAVYSSGIYSGIPRPYDSLSSSNLNTSRADASMQGRGPQNLNDFSIYTRSNNNEMQHAKTVDLPTLYRRSKSPQTNSPLSPKVDISVRHSTNVTTPLPLSNSANAATLVQQNSLNIPRPLFNQETYITAPQHSISSIDKNRSQVERATISPLWQQNVEDIVPAEKQPPFSQSPCESPSPLSPARSTRNICAPTTFSSLRRSNPTSPTSSAEPHSPLLVPQRRETPVTQPPQDRKIHFEIGPVHTPTIFSSVSPISHTSLTTSSLSLIPQKRESPVSPSLSQVKNIQLNQAQSSPILSTPTFSSAGLSSPISHTSPTTPSSALLSQRQESTVSPLSQVRQTQLKQSETSPVHISSLVPKFNFDLSVHQNQRYSSMTSVATGSSAIPEKTEASPMNHSPYDSLLSVRQTHARASSPPITQRLRSPSFDRTVNTSKTGFITRTPSFLLKFSKEQLNDVGKQPLQVTPHLRSSMSLDTQVQLCTKQPVYTISDAKDTENSSPRITLSPPQPSTPGSTLEAKFHKGNEKFAILRTDSVSKASLTQTEKKGHQHSQPVSVPQKASKQETKDEIELQCQKWSIFTSKNQKDGSVCGKVSKPPLEKTKKPSVGNRMDQVLDRMDQMFRSFTIKNREDNVHLEAENMSSHQKSSSSGSCVRENQERLESCGQSANKQVRPHSVSKTVSGLGLLIQDQVVTKPPKPQKKSEVTASPHPTGDNKTKPQQKQKSHVNQSATLPANWRTETNESDHLFFKAPEPMGDYKTNHLQKQKNVSTNQYATLPANWRTNRVSSHPRSIIDFYTEDVKSNSSFSNTSQPRRKTTSLCEPQDDHRISNTIDEEGWLPSKGKLSPCSDIRYGLNQNRSFSVSSVQSSRPSGTGRISRSSSRANSISDLTSAAELMTLDDIVTQEVTLNPDESCGGKPKALQIGTKNESPNPRFLSPTSLERTSFLWENEGDPTPPPSPTFSPTTRRVSHAPNSSPQGIWASQDGTSARGHLPSKNYTCSLSVFEESDSDSTTTDDEYYLDNENGEETEL